MMKGKWFLYTFIIMTLPILCNAQDDESDEYSLQKDSFFKIQTPHFAVDSLFILFILIHSVYYSYILINYSLENLVIKKEAHNPHHHKMKFIEEMADDSIELTLKSDYFDTSAPQFTTSHYPMHFSIVSFEDDIDNLRQRKPSNTQFCCCMRFVGVSFCQWKRTFIPRLILRLYMALSCLLSMVLYIEFLVNILIEYIITCITHYNKGYIIGFIMIPVILYITYILFHFAWHSIVAAWRHSADINGDLDSYDNEMIDSLECLQKSRHNDDIENFQYSWTKDLAGPPNSNEDIKSFKQLVSNEDFDSIMDRMEAMMLILKQLDDECDAKMHMCSNDLAQRKSANTNPNPAQIEMEMMNQLNQNEAGGNQVQLIPNSTDSAYMNHSDDMEKKDDVQIQDANPNKQDKKQKKITPAVEEKKQEYLDKFDIDLDCPKSTRKAARKLRDELRFYFKKAHQKRLADYYLPTCWRFGFFFYTLFFTVLAALSIELDGSLNGLFEGLVLRYCIIAGFIWNVCYTLFAFFLAVHSRFATWKIIHSKFPKKWFFCLVDAHDIEQYIGKSKGWTFCKIIVMSFSCLIFIAFLITGIAGFYTGKKWGGFLAFIGIIWFLYYLCNLLMSAKPYSLISLWTDTIPLPGQNYTIHHDKMIDLAFHGQFTDIGHCMDRTYTEDVNCDTGRCLTSLHYINNALRSQHHQHHSFVKSIQSKLKIDLDKFDKYSDECDKFKEHRKDNLMKRYRHFLDYTYIADDKKEDKKCCHCFLIRWYKKGVIFYRNYSHYWLHCYRPFDEYDIDSTSNIMQGFKCIQCCIDRRICNIKHHRPRNHEDNDDDEEDHKFFQMCGIVCDWISDNICNCCLCCIFVIFVGLLWFTADNLSGNTVKDYHITDVLYDNANATQNYAICYDTWSDSDQIYDLSVLDILYIAECSYELDKYDAQDMMDWYFGEGVFNVITQNTTEPYHFHIKHEEYNLDIISIRGTATPMDVLQDMSLYVEVTLLEGLKWWVPFLNGLSVSFIRQIIYYASKTEGVINSDVREKYDEPIYDYITKYLNMNSGETNMYFVGHSLGGSISQVVAARLYEDNIYSNTHFQSFGICSPGALYTSSKFGFGVESLEMTASSLLPRRDYISNIDVHGGSIQWTNCNNKNPIECHFIASLICDVIQNCPQDTAINIDVFEYWCDQYAQLELGEDKPFINAYFNI